MKKKLTILRLIHGSPVVGLLLFCGFAYWKNAGLETTSNLAHVFIYMVPLAAAVAYFACTYIFQNSMQNMDHNKGLPHKIGVYQRASIVKYALLEAPSILALIAYYLTGNALHLVIALCVIAYLISQRPTEKRFRNDLRLTIEQKQIDPYKEQP